MNFIEEVTSYEHICTFLQKDPTVRPDVSAYDEEDKEAAIAAFILWRVSKAAWLMAGKTIDWDDWDQNKYYGWFDLSSEAGSGSGFSYFYYVYDHDCSNVGARLVFPTSAEAKHAAKIFETQYKALYKIG